MRQETYTTSVCPICLDQKFVDFRGREEVQCNTCQSLERHRTLRLFMLSMTPNRFKLIAENVGALRKIQRRNVPLSIVGLDSCYLGELKYTDSSDTVVFLENIIGFKEISNKHMVLISALYERGATIAFTCKGGEPGRQKEILHKLFGADFECTHFDLKKNYGDKSSDNFRLNLVEDGTNVNDIFYVEAEKRCALA